MKRLVIPLRTPRRTTTTTTTTITAATHRAAEGQHGHRHGHGRGHGHGHRGWFRSEETPRRRGLRHQRPGGIYVSSNPAAPVWNAARHLSSSTSSSSSSSSPSLKDKEKDEHDRRVAAAQALILAGLARRSKSLPLPLPKHAGPRVAPAVAAAATATEAQVPVPVLPSPSSPLSTKQRRAVLRTIQHWLSKDPTFFVATMEAMDLDLNLRGPNHETRNGIKPSNASSAIGIGIEDENHPLRAVWEQYQQLYHESIPKFLQTKLEEEERPREDQSIDKDKSHGKDNGNGNATAAVHYETEIKNVLLEKLASVGFGDSNWSHRFRRVPNYLTKHEQWTRTIDELHEANAALAKERKNLASLEEDLVDHRTSRAAFPALGTDPETGFAVVAGGASNYRTTGKAKTKAQRREERLRRKEQLRRASNNLKKEQVDDEKADDLRESTTSTVSSGSAEKEKSFFWRAWESVCSSIWADSGPRSSETSVESNTDDRGFSRPTTSQLRNELSGPAHRREKGSNNATDAGGSDFEEFRPFLPPKTQRKGRRLLRRIDKKRDIVRELQETVDRLTEDVRKAERSRAGSKPPIPLEEYQRAALVVAEARDSICREFAEHIEEKHAQSIRHYQLLDAKTDLTKPHEWYSYARLDRRKIVFHGGPTNSGKTYAALQRLKEAKKGLYLGPLRLLAAEVYETLTAEGLYTNLFTGQERREIAFSTHTAATVEMCSVDEEYDVAVIDEIQMISDPTRGSAWTKALLGLRCKEIHVCGGLEAMGIVRKLADACGDDFEVNQYERFSDLKVSKKSLAKNPNKTGSYRNVRPGDCIVAFSRNDIFAIKREIESLTNHKCCVIYGKLPPQTRADQARRFNDPDSGYDVLVASDAIGMGLNLNIKRIVFNSVFKFNGEKIVRLGHSDVKQISGRAGRRNSPYPNGEVTCRDFLDLGYVRKCLSTEIAPLRKAALLPTESHIELFAQAVSASTPIHPDADNDADSARSHPDLHKILQQFSAMATVRGDYFLGRQTEMNMIAKRLKNIPIRLRDAYTMCLSPTTELSVKLLETFATKVSQNEVFGLPSRSVPRKARSFDDLSYLCNIYSDVDLFMWLQYKFPPGNAVELATALARKERTMEFINEALSATERLKLEHCYLKTAQRHRSVWEKHNGGPASRKRLDAGEDGLEEEEDQDEEGDDDDDFVL